MNGNRFAPVYTEPDQVIRCVQTMMNKSVKDAKLVINIGFNKTDFSSSTEWLITTSDDRTFVLTTSVAPQNATYIQAEAGCEISKDNNGKTTLTYNNKPAILITPNGEEFNFVPGSPIRITIANGAVGFVGNDCAVSVEILPNVVVYRILTDHETVFAQYVNNKLQACPPNTN